MLHFFSSFQEIISVCPDQPVDVHTSAEYVHIFTDGAMRLDSGFAVVGGVIRDKKGLWITGFHHFLGKCSAFNAKLWGILEGLKLIQRLGYDHVIIHSDSLEVVKGIHEGSSNCSNSALIRRIHSIMSQENHWSLQYISREQNQIVDCFAKQALIEKENLQVLDVPPEMARVLIDKSTFLGGSFI
ncbi:hypothetical protein J1N35_005034 [Gossypium stocksii]|uniref:RNase H type-1 domain-containing protein n=1 Tax=Gossypium stocksii TaxID=47602 RepID=A0A9D3WC35_9ROSI|nr:hypothetical protein J1N35_005034 [Gossypium stocksii]